MKPTAVIDIGTNTFHLLIVESKQQGFDESFRSRKYIKLGEHSPDFIGHESFQRGLTAIIEFSEICKIHGVGQIFALGTAMLRNAINSPAFISAVYEATKIRIDVIDGKEEARLIFQGATQSGVLSGKHDLLVDIGGGSVEFIFSQNGHAEWMDSIDIGVALLKHRFPLTEVLKSDKIYELENYLQFKLINLNEQLTPYSQMRLVGISGTFDVILDHFKKIKNTPNGELIVLNSNEVINFCNQIIPLSLSDKLLHPSIPESRADLISYALILVRKILLQFTIQEIVISTYSIKEGKIADLV